MNTTKKPVWPKVLGVIVLVLALLVGGLYWFANSKLDRLHHSTEASPIPETEVTDMPLDEEMLVDAPGTENMPDVDRILTPDGEIVTQDGILNILLLGTDERSYQFNIDARADSITLLSLNFNDGSVNLTSLERYMGVEMLGGKYPGKIDYLNHCFRWGGADLMLEEVREYFKVDVDKYIRVNFTTFAQIIDSLGGIDIELTNGEAGILNCKNATTRVGAKDEHGHYIQFSTHTQYGFKKGINHLYGPAALTYARTRSIDSNWERIERQRNVLQACITRLKEIDLRTVNNMIDEVLPLVDTNFTNSELISLALKCPKFIGTECDQLTIPIDRYQMGRITTYTRNRAWAPDYEFNSAVMHEAIYGSPEKAQQMIDEFLNKQ